MRVLLLLALVPLIGCASAIEAPGAAVDPLVCRSLDETLPVGGTDSIDALQLQVLENDVGYLMGTAGSDGFTVRHLDARLSTTTVSAFEGAGRRWFMRAYGAAFVLVSGPLEVGASEDVIRVQPLTMLGEASGAPSTFAPDQPARLVAADIGPGRLYLGYTQGGENVGRAEAVLTVTPEGAVRVSPLVTLFTTRCPDCVEMSMGPNDTWLRGRVEARQTLHHLSEDGIERSWDVGWGAVDTFHRDLGGRAWAFSAWFGHGRHQTAHTLDERSETGLADPVGTEFDSSRPLWMDTPSGLIVVSADFRLASWPVADTANPASLLHCEDCGFERQLRAAQLSQRLGGYLLGIASVDEVRIVCIPTADVVPVTDRM